MRVVFLGTPQFGLPALEQIHKAHHLVACVCQPDKAGARGKMEFSPIKKFALQHDIALFQFEKISRDGVEVLRSLNADIMVTAAYGQILSQEVIDIAPHGIINIHGSLLPKLRGAAPIQYALLKGFEQTGITIVQTVRAVDAGAIILQKSTEILPYENFGSLYQRLSVLGAEAVIEALQQIQDGTAIFTPQVEEDATFTQKITAEDEEIDWNKSAKDIINLVRTLSPDTGARTCCDGKILKIFDLRLADKSYQGKAGQVVECGKKQLVVQCGDGNAVQVKQLQLQNAKKLDICSFLCGRKVCEGTVLGRCE